MGYNWAEQAEHKSEEVSINYVRLVRAAVTIAALAAILFLACPVWAKGPPGVVIDHQAAPTGEYIGSPSLAILPNGDYVSSHDLFGPRSSQTTSGVTRVFRSLDQGRSWKRVAVLHDQFWSNLFVLHGGLYLMGSSYEYGRIVIRKSLDGGVTWSAPSYLSQQPGYHTAPVPVVVANGRIWRAMEYHPRGPWGHFEAFVLSAPEDADLLKAKSWTMTERLPYPAKEPVGNTWLEGNAVVDPHGSVLDILRVNNVEKAAILKVTARQLKFKRLVDFPGGSKKFTIRYDPVSRKYWTLSNPALKKYPLSASNPAMVRNTLALMSSKNLRHWKIDRIVLSHPNPAKYAFQYVDWQFDGSDIVAVSRTAFDDHTGGAHRAHDANYLTFHRIKNFRRDPGRR
jgi:hypothetical protein